ncbi:hypothetical protein QE152_g31380 [Popillia japonica]|uniref:Uncharacterized protein n=1 Tax=Popillia japonica TaxID=7064 RepID=A0AAW1J1R2_POPJA
MVLYDDVVGVKEPYINCNRLSEYKPISKTHKVKPKILIVADSHGRNFSEAIKKACGTDSYDVVTIFKPNAGLDDVVVDLDSLAADYSREDCVVVLGGSNNALRNGKINLSKLQSIKRVSCFTNVLLVSTPYWPGSFDLNKCIYNFNQLVFEKIVRDNDVKYVDCN